MGEPELAVEAPADTLPATPEPSATVQESSQPLESEKLNASSAESPAEPQQANESKPNQDQPAGDSAPVVTGVNESGEAIISGMTALQLSEPAAASAPAAESVSQAAPEAGSGQQSQEAQPPSTQPEGAVQAESAPAAEAAPQSEPSAPSGEQPVQVQVMGTQEAAPEATQQPAEAAPQQPAEEQQAPSAPAPAAEEPAAEKPVEAEPPAAQAPAEQAAEQQQPKAEEQPSPAQAQPEAPQSQTTEEVVASSAQQEAAPPSENPTTDSGPAAEPAQAPAPAVDQAPAQEAPVKPAEEPSAPAEPAGNPNPNPNPAGNPNPNPAAEPAGEPIPVKILSQSEESGQQQQPAEQQSGEKPAWLPEGVLSPSTEKKVIDFITAHETHGLPSGVDRSVNFQYQRETQGSHKLITSGAGASASGVQQPFVPAGIKEAMSADVPKGDLDALNKLQEQLNELGFAHSPMSNMVTQQMGVNTGGPKVQFAMEGHRHRHVKTTTNTYQGSGSGAPLDQAQQQFQQQVQQLSDKGTDFAAVPQTGSSTSEIREERMLPDGTKMIIRKTATRTVKSTHTVYRDGKPITTTIENPGDANPNQGSS